MCKSQGNPIKTLILENVTKDHLLFEFAESEGDSLLKYSIFAKNLSDLEYFGRIICFHDKASWVYEGQLHTKKPHGFGRKIFKENDTIFSYVG